jgi:hypothetical protein
LPPLLVRMNSASAANRTKPTTIFHMLESPTLKDVDSVQSG